MFRRALISIAIARNNNKRVEALVSNGYLKSRSYFRGTPLFLRDAVANLKVDLASILLEAGHPLTLSGASLTSFENPSLLYALISSARKDIDSALMILELLSKHGLSFNGIIKDDRDGRTPLMFASGKDNLERLITRMIQLGANPNERDANGKTALFYCINSTEHVEALIDAGADPYIQDEMGDTAEQSALLRQNISGMLYHNTYITELIACRKNR